ncbi:MAG: PAS domain-containing hybrid sensor histidine kinase/response regulator [Rubrivivax sp.]|nr:MAG: PAS domain-containing hybrid sensor histidine kinase/response regulator [Rubrivivax sp.]
MMKRLSTRFYLALGLSSLLVTVVLTASFIGLIPDREALVRHHRAVLSETLAITASVLLNEDEPGAMEEALKLALEREPDLKSIGVRRRADGELLSTLGEHAGWTPLAGQHSTDAQIQVPLWHDGEPWGSLEMRFTPLRREGWVWSILDDPSLRLSAFLASVSFVLFALYLGRMLRHLDPSTAIPGRVRSALDTLTEGLMVLDAKGYTVLANQSLARIMGVEPDALIGKLATQLPWTDRQGQPLDKAHLPWIDAVKSGETRRNVLMYLQTQRGQRYTFRVNCSPILAAQKAQGVLISFQDVTELEEKELALQMAKEEADSANRSKSAFLANMSHEIRTPMNAILGFTEILRRGGQNPQNHDDRRRHLDTIHASGTHLLELINDILDLSKVESGRLDLERVAFAPHSLVQEVVHVLEVKAQEKGLPLRMELPQSLPATVLGDPSRLRQVVTNLVGNAIKFTASGEVTVTLRLDNTPAGPRYCIDVKDTGVGIPPDKLESVFEPFVQAESSTARRFGGTGLGLTISRRITRAMGGDIICSSTVGEGSTFHVSFDPGPLDDIEYLAPAQLRAQSLAATIIDSTPWVFPRKRILVVDDGAENRELIRLVLEETGLHVTEAADGQIALDLVAEQRFDLILMDMQMPVVDGVTATRLMRQRGIDTPILAITANAMKGFEKDVHDAGFTGFHTKPLNIDTLLADLAQRLGGEQRVADASLARAHALKGRPVSADNLSSAAPGLEPGAAALPMVSRLSQHPKLRNVVQKFIAQFPAKQAAMDEALARQDWHALSLLAHWLKGAGGSVGFDDYFEPARELENACKALDAAQAERWMAHIHRLSARMVLDAPQDGVTA